MDNCLNIKVYSFIRPRLVLTALMIFILFSCNNQGDKQTELSNPNVILIMADDLGYNDIGCYGNTNIKTPNIDYLAANGLKFNDYHSNGPVCSPTRAALMTGRYQQRAGIEAVVTAKNHRHTGMEPSEFTLGDYFKSMNYKTAIIGKWHLGYDTTFSPVNNGFDYFHGYVSGNVDYHSHIDQEGYYDWWENKDTLDEPGYSTDLITEAALLFISENKGSPFFLYVAHEAPHGPYQGRNDPPIRKVGPDFRIPHPKVDIERAYKEMVEVMDEGIGKIVDFLSANDLLDKTLILFCSDNGAWSTGSNFPLNGFKASLWEGGHRVPAIAFWNGRIKAGVSNETVLSMDIFPTLINLVNPNDQREYDFDGQSFMSQLSGDPSSNTLSQRPLFWRFNDQKTVRQGEWKLLIIKDEQYLFNLNNDISEESNLRDDFPQKGDSLLQLLNKWEAEMKQYPLRTN